MVEEPQNGKKGEAQQLEGKKDEGTQRRGKGKERGVTQTSKIKGNDKEKPEDKASQSSKARAQGNEPRDLLTPSTRWGSRPQDIKNLKMGVNKQDTSHILTDPVSAPLSGRNISVIFDTIKGARDNPVDWRKL